MDLAGKTVGVLVEDLYHDLEVWYPIYRLREDGATVLVVGTGSKSVYRSKHGGEITPDCDINKINPNDFDGLIIAGGYAPDILRSREAVLVFVREMFHGGKLLASICHGPWVLCSAKILPGRQCTSIASIKDDVIHAGAEWVDEAVCVDGNLITSRRPDDLPAFLPAIIKALGKEPECRA